MLVVLYQSIAPVRIDMSKRAAISGALSILIGLVAMARGNEPDAALTAATPPIVKTMAEQSVAVIAREQSIAVNAKGPVTINQTIEHHYETLVSTQSQLKTAVQSNTGSAKRYAELRLALVNAEID
jgi:hypothetical protein